MKITSLSLDIREKDFEEYEETLIQKGWKKVKGQHIYQKTFGETEVEIREHIAAFSAEVTLKLTARNEQGIKLDRIIQLLQELDKADHTPDQE